MMRIRDSALALLVDAKYQLKSADQSLRGSARLAPAPKPLSRGVRTDGQDQKERAALSCTRPATVGEAGVKSMKSASLGLFAALALSACATQPGTIFRTLSLDDGTTFTTGARQRVVSNIEPGVASRPGLVDPQRIVCAEPSPDVAIAVANSFGAGVSIAGQGSGSISGAQAEGIAQLAERTVAIQALLNKGYQACLNYANGAISGTQYSLRTSRLDDLMVTLILAEVAGGGFGRSGAAIGTKASATASAKLAEGLREDLDTAKADLAKANENVAEKQVALDDAETALAVDADNEGLKGNVKAAKAELKVAKAERDALLQLMTTSADTATEAAAEASKVIALGGLTPKVDGTIAKELGAMQARFIDKDISQDFISTCLIELGLWKTRSAFDDDFTGHALGLLKANEEGITDETIRDFFLGTQIGGRTSLTEYCKDNLAEFIEKVRIDNQTARLKRLEIESKRLDLLSRQTVAESEKPATVVHPLASYNLLKNDDVALKAQKVKLTGKTTPPVSATFLVAARNKLVAEHAALVQIVDAILAQAVNALAVTEKAKLDQIEARYISIMVDTKKTGTPSERKLWQADFNQQQASGEHEDKKLKELSKKLNDASDEVDALIRKIDLVS